MTNYDAIYFFRCFEFHAAFPHDHTLRIAVRDYDIGSADDLIGETEIDLEIRYLTKHSASCGISETYEEYVANYKFIENNT